MNSFVSLSVDNFLFSSKFIPEIHLSRLNSRFQFTTSLCGALHYNHLFLFTALPMRSKIPTDQNWALMCLYIPEPRAMLIFMVCVLMEWNQTPWSYSHS